MEGECEEILADEPYEKINEYELKTRRLKEWDFYKRRDNKRNSPDMLFPLSHFTFYSIYTIKNGRRSMEVDNKKINLVVMKN